MIQVDNERNIYVIMKNRIACLRTCEQSDCLPLASLFDVRRRTLLYAQRGSSASSREWCLRGGVFPCILSMMFSFTPVCTVARKTKSS